MRAPAIVLAFALLLVGCIGPAGTPQEDPDVPATDRTELFVATNRTGAFGFHAVFDFASTGDCSIEEALSYDRDDLPVAWYGSINSTESRDTRWYVNRHPLQGHRGSLDTRPDPQRDRADMRGGKAAWHLDVDPQGRVAFTTGFANLRAETESGYTPDDERFRNGTTWFLDIECEEPFEVRKILTGTEHVGFHDQWGLSGGEGASVEPTFGTGVGYADGDRLETSLRSPVVLSQITEFEGFGSSSGELSVDRPNGSETWQLGAADEPAPARETTRTVWGGPGDYRVALDGWRSVGSNAVIGVLLGLGPVDLPEDRVNVTLQFPG